MGATWDAGLAWLTVAIALNTVNSLFYYLRWIRAALPSAGQDREVPRLGMPLTGVRTARLRCAGHRRDGADGCTALVHPRLRYLQPAPRDRREGAGSRGERVLMAGSLS